ncbi:MAG: DUF1015 domain-containing protein [Planctomycetota bacterium]|nr:MAG: DUF1015 domain-containing protein [Planctomycetota bacterium]
MIMQIKPFKALRFNETVVGDAGSCIAPPYDVISSAQQQQLYEKSEYNIVRIIKGKQQPSDDSKKNRYTRAADHLNTWLQKGVLTQDRTDTIYAYVQDFHAAGRDLQRNSFIALAKLEEYGKTVRPHEHTLDEPKVDRLNLRKATDAEFGLVFMLYEDKQSIADKIIERAAKQKPLIDSTDEQDVRHRLFAITLKDDIEQITNMMLDKNCIIADGHHRYETALNYQKQTPNAAAAYQMIAFVNTCQEGLLIFATHRLVASLENFSFEKLLADLKNHFDINEFPFDSPQAKTEAKEKMLNRMKAELALDKHAFGIYAANSAFYTAVLRDSKIMDSAESNMSLPSKALDVSVLHRLILEQLLGIDEKKLARGGNIEYVKDTNNAIDESIAKTDQGQKQIAFFMNPVTMQQLKTVTDAGERMPQKTTYFYPKVNTGLTINKL